MMTPRALMESLGLAPYMRKLKLIVRCNHATVPTMKFPTFDPTTHHSLIWIGDYFRYATVGLALRRILQENIGGHLAELGVYRGEMSRFIHSMAPEKALYLFDTFAGFPTRDFEPGVLRDDRFKDTSVETVLKRVGDARNVVIRKGYLPDTLQGLEDQRFAFVLLDLDLYKPTRDGLRFLYPRLTRGGYLLVHDYNNPESDWACKRALDEYMSDKPEKIIEIADEWGTALFRKS